MNVLPTSPTPTPQPPSSSDEGLSVTETSAPTRVAPSLIAAPAKLWSLARWWVAENTFESAWLPPALRSTAAGFALAIVLELLASLLMIALVYFVPSFALFSILNILVVVLVALTWGAAPGLVATIAAAVTLEWMVLPFADRAYTNQFGDLIEVLSCLAIGAVITIFASGVEQARRRALIESAESRARERIMREANERTDEFVSIASHELRSPLTSLKAALQLAQRRIRRLDPQQITPDELAAQIETLRGLITTAEQQVDRQDRLVGELLDVSRIRAGRLEYHHTECDLCAIVTEAVTEQRLSWPDRSISLKMAQAPLRIDADALRIGQVVTNYLTNALKYSTADAPVAVTVSAKGAVARVAVRDHGPGLTSQQQAHVWERFHRAPGIQQMSGSGAGLGLGLHIARTIVQHHKGRVGIRSVPKRGSTFWFTVPLVASVGRRSVVVR